MVAAHPALFHPPASGPAAALGSPACGIGWRDLLERCCVRIEAALSSGDRFEFQEIKSKYGGLRVCWGGRMSAGAASRAREAVDLAEARSHCTCECCGDEGRLHHRGDWLSTRCARHADGSPVSIRPGFENLHLVQRFVGGRLQTITCARYDRESDSFVDISPSTFESGEE
jgi:hypothetical protein